MAKRSLMGELVATTTAPADPEKPLPPPFGLGPPPRAGGQGEAAAAHLRIGAALDAGDVAPGVDATAGRLHRAGQPLQVAQRVELPLVGEAERRPALPSLHGDAGDDLQPFGTGAGGGVALLLQEGDVAVGGEEPVAVHAEEVAVDGFGGDGALDGVDGALVALV